MGTIDQSHLAGRMELCDDEGNWRSVCISQWDALDARVACRQMGYSDQGEYHLLSCDCIANMWL